MTKRRPILTEDRWVVNQATKTTGGAGGTFFEAEEFAASPVFDPVPAPGEPPFVPPPTKWNTAVPGELPGGAMEGLNRMTWGFQTFYQTVVGPTQMDPGIPELTGVWYGIQNPAPGTDPTLWHVNAYNVYGLVQDLEVWEIGDFVKGREGHGLYIRTMPNLDTTIRRYNAYKMGAQAIQREWRLSETQIPQSVWGAGGGTFLVEDCDFRECGRIDQSWTSSTGGSPSAPRASWVMSLYNTKQHTIVRDVTVINYYSPTPHEGALAVLFGQNAWRTPTLLVEDCTFYCKAKDRAEIFLQGVDDALIQHTYIYTDTLSNPNAVPYIDIVQGCPKTIVSQMPQDVLVREKKATGPHNAPVNTYLVKKGTTVQFNF